MLQFKPERPHITDYATHQLSLCGKALVADASGALFWPAESTLIVADLHLEKGSSFAARGIMLPPYDTRQTLQRLAEVIDRFDPREVLQALLLLQCKVLAQLVLVLRGRDHHKKNTARKTGNANCWP